MPSDTVISLVNSHRTLTKAVSENPNEQISRLAQDLYAHEMHQSSSSAKHPSMGKKREEYSQEDLDRAAKCGKFPYRPSNLFLMIYCDVLDTLDRDPWVGMTSPPLLGSSGLIPLSIISIIPDIMRHYRNLIIHAEFEVMLATNYWEISYSSSLIHEALKELSRRHEGRSRKPVVKLMYDRGNIKQVVKSRQPVPCNLWEGVGLPREEEIPNIDFQVLNYHQPIMGTFHSKYMIVDRKIACLNSNNIQDRVNVEMMTHLEGNIVDSFYDMALLTWGDALQPPLPLLSRSPIEHKREESKESTHVNENPSAMIPPPAQYQSTRPREDMSAQHREDTTTSVPVYLPQDVNHPKEAVDPSDPDPISKQHLPQPEPESGVLVEARNTASELAAAVRKYGAARAVANHLNAGMQQTDPTANDEVAEGFDPHILHRSRTPFPIALVSRPPYGCPKHDSLHVPQNVAWLAGFRLAQKSIFIQTPTFNASPAVEEILNACRRGVECTLYLNLGFNDAGEMLPFQGGTNSQVVSKMYSILNAEGKQEYLKVFWYTAKDQDKPMDAAEKRRTCHVKFCMIDDEIGFQGNGNQDTQSWFHSQEINVMVDSSQLCAEWRAGLEANQNTARYGRISTDGLWRDSEGHVMDSQLGRGGIMQFTKGVMGTIARVRGEGGF